MSELTPQTRDSGSHLGRSLSVASGHPAERTRSRVPVADLARQSIDRSFRDRVSLSTLARELEVSREHLCRSFRTRFNKTVTDYVRERRIREALQLLDESRMQLKEVGSTVGYSNYNEFFRAFKRVVQMTPTGYLKQSRNSRSSLSAAAS